MSVIDMGTLKIRGDPSEIKKIPHIFNLSEKKRTYIL